MIVVQELIGEQTVLVSGVSSSQNEDNHKKQVNRGGISKWIQ